ncbi:MAG TPA: DNA/RNA non-specific endonuclease [Phycisphaerae bacterium]|nr:DNA/RNA non-specific endonuclease [Phycisphaerae bacterium]
MEATLSTDELARRLADTIESIGGPASIEEFVGSTEDADFMEGVSSRRITEARNAASKLQRGRKPSAASLYHLEAIVHRKHRPSHRIRNNTFDAFPGEFRRLRDDPAIYQRIKETFSAIGRIDITELATYEGTGFVVGRNLVMTNRHVAEAFTKGVGRLRIQLQPLGPEIDFREEPSSERPDGFALKEPVMVHPYWDMALFEADLPDIEPLKLSTTTYEALLNRNQVIVAIGYPARDPRNGLQAQREIFGDEFEVKRIAPGRISRRKRAITSRWLSAPVAALAHDASTLGGASGSAIINVDDGTVAGLHFAGRYLIENYGVPGYELARDPRIIDAGVQFAGARPAPNDDLDAIWLNTESPDSTPGDAMRRSQPQIVISHANHTPLDRSNPMSERTDDLIVEIPLRIHISLGRPTNAPAAGVGANAGGAQTEPDDLDDTPDYEMGESTGSGYDPEFLNEETPVPTLPKKLAKDAFHYKGSPLIHYTHFSVCQSKSRRLPRFVAWNIDGGEMKQLSRKGIKFILDRRVPQEYQAGNELYVDNKYDRGHVARRADLNWGPVKEAKRANRDSFFFTNMTPQHEKFNQSSKGGLWGRLENAIFEDVDVEDLRVSVIAGPIFRDDDKTYRNVQIPADFWKLIAFHDAEDDEFKVAAFIITQRDLVFTERRQIDDFRLYQVSLSKLADETGLNFDEISDFDSFDSQSESVRGAAAREITSRESLF